MMSFYERLVKSKGIKPAAWEPTAVPRTVATRDGESRSMKGIKRMAVLADRPPMKYREICYDRTAGHR